MSLKLPKRRYAVVFLSWLAGFYEGEGTAFISRNKTLVITVTQKEKRLLLYITHKLGFGKLYISRRDKFVCWKLVMQARVARHFSKLILPYMKSKKKISQLKRALTYVK